MGRVRPGSGLPLRLRRRLARAQGSPSLRDR
jgi:hypothetical protein